MNMQAYSTSISGAAKLGLSVRLLVLRQLLCRISVLTAASVRGPGSGLVLRGFLAGRMAETPAAIEAA